MKMKVLKVKNFDVIFVDVSKGEKEWKIGWIWRDRQAKMFYANFPSSNRFQNEPENLKPGNISYAL